MEAFSIPTIRPPPPHLNVECESDPRSLRIDYFVLSPGHSKYQHWHEGGGGARADTSCERIDYFVLRPYRLQTCLREARLGRKQPKLGRPQSIPSRMWLKIQKCYEDMSKKRSLV